jgi:MtfA peptidase
MFVPGVKCDLAAATNASRWVLAASIRPPSNSAIASSTAATPSSRRKGLQGKETAALGDVITHYRPLTQRDFGPYSSCPPTMFSWLRRRRRAGIRRRTFPAEWLAIIAKNVPYVARLPREDREALVGLMQVFLAEKHFEGCGGLQMTDEVRVTIAAQACTLLLHRETDDYPNLVSILVYPTTYLVRGGRPTADGLSAEGPEARLGESWARDVVVLAWDSVLSGAADIHDGHNVVLHEFAHQLDQESSASAGVPVLPHRSMYVAWARVLGHDFDRLVRDVAHHHRTLIDRYGATNPAEFFAVVTETFFEKPGQLRSRHPELYLLLKEFYHQDPAAL